jgi:hypothetical protein
VRFVDAEMQLRGVDSLLVSVFLLSNEIPLGL